MCSRSLRAFLCSIVVSGLVACGWSQPLPKHAWTIPSECERLELHVASDEQGHRQMRWAALEPWLRCVDANGSLRPLLRWVDGWNSHDKERIAQWFSSAFLNSDQNGLGSRLWGLVGVFNSQTQSTGTLIAELLAEKEWIDSLAQLQADLEWHGGFFEQWADLLAVLRVVESAVEQPFLNDFFNHLREAQWNGESSERPSEWDAAWKGMQRFAQVSVSQGLYDPWSTSLELLSSGSFLESMQRVWDLEEPNIRAHLSDAKQMFEHHLFQKDNVGKKSRIERLGDLLRNLNRPMRCFGQRREVPNAAQLALNELSHYGLQDELATFVRRDFRLRVLLSKEVCDQPVAVGDDPGLFTDFASTTALWPMVRVLRAMDAPMRTWLIQSMSQPHWSALSPLFQWLERHQIWGDLLTMTSWVPISDRKDVQVFFSTLQKHQSKFSKLATSVSSLTVARAVTETARVFFKYRERLPQGIQWFRWWMMSAIDQTKVGESKLPEGMDLVWMARIAKGPDFVPAMRFLGEGFEANRWQPIISGLLKWIKAPKSAESLDWVERPDDKPKPLHQLSSLDLKRPPFELLPTTESLQACDQIDLSKTIREQWSAVWACLGQAPMHLRPGTDLHLWSLWDNLRIGLGNGSHAYAKAYETFAHHPRSELFLQAVGDWSQQRTQDWKPWIDLWQRKPISQSDQAEFFQFLADGLEILTASNHGTEGLVAQQSVNLGLLREKTLPWIRQVDCVFHPRKVQERLHEIEEDYSKRVHIDEMNGTRAKLAWSGPDFKARWSSIAELFKKNPAWLSAWTRFLKKHPDIWDWVAERISDPEPLMLYAPNQTVPHVRWASTLDLLELLLTNADVSYVSSKNYSYYYMQLIGEAWGDEPRANWPLDIQRRYPKSLPRTLKHVAEMIEEEAAFFESKAGYPADTFAGWKPCEPIQQDPLVVPRIKMSPWVTSWADDDLRRRAFNLRQAMPALVRNLADSGHSQAGGLKVLRDLLWELIEATPQSARHASSEKKHAFALIPALSRLGVLSWGMQDWKLKSVEDAKWTYFREGLKSWSTIDATVMETLFEKLLGLESLIDRVWSMPSDEALAFKNHWIDWMTLVGQLEPHPKGPTEGERILTADIQQLIPWLEAFSADFNAAYGAFEKALKHAYLLPKKVSWENLEWVSRYPKAGQWSVALFMAMDQVAFPTSEATPDLKAIDPALIQAMFEVAKSWMRDPNGAPSTIAWLEKDPQSFTLLVAAWFQAARDGTWKDMMDAVERGMPVVSSRAR